MKKIFLSALIAIIALLSGSNDCNAKTISKCKIKKVSSYFSKMLNGECAGYKGKDKIKPADIEDARKAVWECWSNAVMALDEEKLIAPFSTDEPRDTGYWKLPEQLEEHAVMPYYFIKKGEQPKEGYPLFLYMHGSGEKNREWETGIRLCDSYDDAPSLHFIPPIPNGYGEL